MSSPTICPRCLKDYGTLERERDEWRVKAELVALESGAFMRERDELRQRTATLEAALKILGPLLGYVAGPPVDKIRADLEALGLTFEEVPQ